MDGLFGDSCSTLYLSSRPYHIFENYFHHQFWGEGFSLWLAISLNGRLDVLVQYMQIVLPSFRVYVIPSSLVILYVTLYFDMLPRTLLQ